MIDSSKFDVVVTGAGMVGAAAACLFAQKSLRVCLIDRSSKIEWHSGKYHPRVSAVNIASMKLFRGLKVWDAICEKRISPYRSMEVWENNSNANISFSAQDLGLEQLGFIIENDVITSSLLEKLQQNYNAVIMGNLELLESHLQNDHLELLTNDGRTIRTNLLVGADGTQSRVRQICNIDSSFLDYDQDAIVTSVEFENSHKETAWQSFLPTGPVAMLPLENGRCSIVWSCDRPFADELTAMNDEKFCASLSEIFNDRLGKILSCDKRFRFPLRQHHADHYIAKYTALVGDAAHITHPLAGLGANIGFQDVAALAEVVNDAHSNGVNIANHSVLRRYERWRKGENALVLETMKSFKALFGSSQQPVKAARQFGLNLTDQLVPLKNQFARFAMGISGDLPAICKG